MGPATPKYLGLLGDLLRSCWAELFSAECVSCGCLSERLLCGECDKVPWCRSPDPSRSSLLWFAGGWRQLWEKIKLGRRPEWLDYFEPLLAQVDLASVFPPSVLVPVPMHWSDYMKRGFHHTHWLASRIGQTTGWRVDVRAVKKIRRTPPQHTLDRKTRRTNLRDAYAYTGECHSRVVLVDDVATTGSTLETCRECLIQAGVEVVGEWTLFQTPPPNISPGIVSRSNV